MLTVYDVHRQHGVHWGRVVADAVHTRLLRHRTTPASEDPTPVATTLLVFYSNAAESNSARRQQHVHPGSKQLAARGDAAAAAAGVDIPSAPCHFAIQEAYSSFGHQLAYSYTLFLHRAPYNRLKAQPEQEVGEGYIR